MNFVNIIVVIGMGQGLFLAFVLFTTGRGNRRANRILGLLMLLLAFNISYVIIDGEKLYCEWPHLLMLAHPLQYLYGPLLLFYTLLLTRRDFRFLPIHSLHLLAFLLSAVYFTFTFYLDSGAQKIQRYEAWQETVMLQDYFWSLSHIFYNLPYFVAVIVLVKKHGDGLKNRYSAIERINLSWLQKLTALIVLLFSANSIFDLLYLSDISRTAGGPVLALGVVAVIYSIGYLGWRQPEIFTGGEEPPAGEKYQKSTLSSEQAQKYKIRLEEIMEREKPYLKNSLTIKELAGMLNIPAYQLSQVINEKFRQNFFDFINSYRIQEAMEKLSDPQLQHYSILAIAFDVGFNSKSAFNTAFKKQTGATPSQFRKHAAA